MPPQRHAGEVGNDGDQGDHGHGLHGAVEMHQGWHQQNGGAKADHSAQHARAQANGADNEHGDNIGHDGLHALNHTGYKI